MDIVDFRLLLDAFKLAHGDKQGFVNASVRENLLRIVVSNPEDVEGMPKTFKFNDYEIGTEITVRSVTGI